MKRISLMILLVLMLGVWCTPAKSQVFIGMNGDQIIKFHEDIGTFYISKKYASAEDSFMVVTTPYYTLLAFLDEGICFEYNLIVSDTGWARGYCQVLDVKYPSKEKNTWHSRDGYVTITKGEGNVSMEWDGVVHEGILFNVRFKF